MRQGNINGISVSYPDAVVAAFGVNPIIIDGFTGTSVELVVSNAVGSVTEKRSPFANGCFFDLSYFLQVMFGQSMIGNVDYNNAAENGLSDSYSVTLNFFNGVTSVGTHSFNVTALWASYISNVNEHLTMFTGYPFTIGIYSDGTYKGSMNGNSYTFGKNATYNVPVSSEGIFYLSNASGTTVKAINVKEKCGKGIYLRWIDRYGVYRYWLFRQGEANVDVKSNGEFIRKTMGIDNGKRMTSKEAVTEVEVCAPLVDGDTFNFLMGCVLSPVVDMYDNGEWVNVNVSDGDITRERSELQDFVIRIVLPETIIQKL